MFILQGVSKNDIFKSILESELPICESAIPKAKIVALLFAIFVFKTFQ